MTKGKTLTIQRLLGVEKLHPTIKRLLIIRGLRSTGQGAMVVDLTLYLSALHWSGAAIGGVTTGAGFVGSALIFLVGILSDKFGSKPFLLIYEAMTMFCAICACFTSMAIFLVLAIVIAGFGRGQNGGAGPFGPAEQAWLARNIEQVNRGPVFSLNNAIGFMGMAIGSILGGVPAWIDSTSPIVNYRPIFIVVAVLSLICVVIISGTGESQSAEKGLTSENEDKLHEEEKARNEAMLERSITKQENRSLLKLAFVNVLNGLGAGMAGPLMAYWFHLKYGVDSATIGTTLAIGFVLTGFSSIFNGFLARKMGMVKSVTWMRVIGCVMMVALPFMPTFALASVLFVIRGAVNRGTNGNRVALSASLTRDKRRGFATSVNALSMRLPSSIGPSISGYLYDVHLLTLPFLITAGLQLANAAIYQRLFHHFDHARNSEK
ncbi:MFS transporter [Pullulanibacillus sp. KACC 23026]|uniref:MFS transporter n=1 Tax=Pullulanibacillus sp. KACC 23026 TaxID=3028315 RepID=UPI0023B121A5|nr:MFS transporter [Pullulanibacillus sp. KACC 23026]WEG11018.1 MFS transporter [Pullulanibacillus sp. KACC 23026]